MVKSITSKRMALTREDLQAIEHLIEKQLEKQLAPIKTDIKSMKSDLKLLATLSQLDEIKKDKRLRALYDHQG